MTVPTHPTVWEQAAVRWAEHLVESRGDLAPVPALLAAVKAGIEDEGALADALAAAGTTVARAYQILDATHYRDGKRVRLPANPCQASWAPERPCTLLAGHEGRCVLCDVMPAASRAYLARFDAEWGAAVVAFGGGR